MRRVLLLAAIAGAAFLAAAPPSASAAPSPLTLPGGGSASSVVEDADGTVHLVQSPLKGDALDEVTIAPEGTRTVAPIYEEIPNGTGFPDDTIDARIFPGGNALVAFVDRSAARPRVVVRLRTGGVWSDLPLSSLSRDGELAGVDSSASGAAAISYRERRGRSWLAKVALLPVGASQFLPAVTVPSWSNLFERGYAVRYNALGDGVLVMGGGSSNAARPAAAVARVSRDGHVGPVIPLRAGRGYGAAEAEVCDDGTIVTAWDTVRARHKTVISETSIAPGATSPGPITRLGGGAQKLVVGCSAGQAAILTSSISGKPDAGREVMRVYAAPIGRPPTLRRTLRAGMPVKVSFIAQPGGALDLVWEAWFGSGGQAAYLLRGRPDGWGGTPERIATTAGELGIDALAARPVGGLIAAISHDTLAGEQALQLVRTDP